MTPEKLSPGVAGGSVCGAAAGAGAGFGAPLLSGLAFCATSGLETSSAASAADRTLATIKRMDIGRCRVDPVITPLGAHHGRARFVTKVRARGHSRNVEMLRSGNDDPVAEAIRAGPAPVERAVTGPLQGPH